MTRGAGRHSCAPSASSTRPGRPPPIAAGTSRARTRAVRENLARIPEFDAVRLTDLWEHALAAAPWPHPPVWVHGDLLPSNVLVGDDGGLAAVIDFAPGVADPAVELIAAWNLVPAEHRDAFRAALDVDDDTWARGRGWAIVQAAVALPYYRDINPGMTAMARYALGQLGGRVDVVTRRGARPAAVEPHSRRDPDTTSPVASSESAVRTAPACPSGWVRTLQTPDPSRCGSMKSPL